MFPFVMIDKISQFEKFLENAIQMKSLHELDLSKSFVSNLIL